VSVVALMGAELGAVRGAAYGVTALVIAA